MDWLDLFYVFPEDVQPDFLTIVGDEFHHLTHVLRKRAGDSFLATDGRGAVFECRIDELQKNRLRAQITKKRRLVGEPVFKLTLALAILKKGRFEWVLEKATEVGVSSFVPLMTERTIPQTNAISPKRCAGITLAAMKQSFRSVLPTVADVQNFTATCKQAGDYDVKLLAHEQSSDSNLDQVLSNSDPRYVKSGIVCIGPEGGFTDEEVELAQRSGFAVFGLGPRRLRSETAAIVAAALILDRMGELK
ncbi:MAG TPA: RsmE family RNA methyltransferase [bacterium]